MLIKVKNYFSNTKHIINAILGILLFNTLINILSGSSILQTIVPLIYFAIIRFKKNITLSVWNMVFFVWSILSLPLNLFMVNGNRFIISSIVIAFYLIFIIFGNRLKILNRKNLSIAFVISVIVLIISCSLNIKYYLTTKFSISSLGFLALKLGNIRVIILLNIISTLINFLYQVFVIIYFKQYANYVITKNNKKGVLKNE